jgi:hypothetical protein
MFGSQQFEDMVSRPFFPVGKLLFWISLVAGQITGVLVGRCFAGHFFLLILIAQVLTAVAAFLVLYRVLALNILRAIERRKGMNIEKPGVGRGFLYTVLIPIILCGVGFLVISFLSLSSLQD